jgi:hypothetical protein
MATVNKDFRVKNGLIVESGSVTAPSIIKTGGTSSQYLMADGSVSTGGGTAALFWRYTATGGETSLSGLDSASQTLAYTAGIEQVFLNGVMLVRGTDYVATNGTSVTGLSALTAGDNILVIAMVSSGIVSGGTTTNALTIGTGLSGTSFDGSSAVTIAIDSTVATLTGTQIFTNKSISGSTNTLSNIANSSLTNSLITIGSTGISLGGTSTTLAGLSSVTSTSFVGALTGNADTVTNGVYTTGTYSNPAWITGLAWSKISTTPTTLSGYGITDAITSATAASTYLPLTGGTISSDLIVTGNLTVNGTTTTINSTTITVDDKNIELGSITSPTDTTADGGGITLKGTIDKTFNWINATDAWTSSENFDVATGKTYKINGTDVLTSTQVLGKSLPSGTIIGTTDSQTLTNKTIDAVSNTISNIPNSSLTNSSITINGSSVSLGGSVSITGLPSQSTNNGKFLTTDGTTASWSSISLSSNVTGTLPTTNGGTGITSYATGDILYASATNTLSKLSAGANTYVLTMSSGVPTWSAPTGGGTVTSGTILLIDGGLSNSTYTGSGGSVLASIDGGASV